VTDVPDGGPERPVDPAPAAPEPEDGLSLAREIADAYRTTPSQPRRRRRTGGRAAKPDRPQREDASPVAQHLDALVSSQGWTDDLATHRAIGDWPRIVGDEVAQHCHAVEIEDGRLTVQADSTAWATQIKLLAPRILARLNEEIGQGSVIFLDVRGPQGPSWKTGRRSVRGGRGPRDTYG
jgi:predicted nucleic acid-binding Zn ribbon protein